MTAPMVTPRQLLALRRSNRKINIWYGSTRSSKTVGSILDFLNACSTHDGVGLLLVIGVTRDTAWRNIFQPIETEAVFAPFRRFVRYRQGSATARVYGHPVIVVGASDERSWTKIQGMKVKYALGDEAVSWPKSFFDMLVTRLELDDSKLLVTCNPGGSKHYLKTDYIDRRHGNPAIHVERFLLEDNPTISPSFRQMLDQTFTGVFYRRMILAHWVAAEGAVFESWDDAVMVVPAGEVPEGAQVLAVGLDYGTDHPSAGYALSLADGRLWITHEWAPRLEGGGGRKRMTDYELADSFEGFLASLPNPPRFVYADPAGASFREELRRRRIVTYRADNSVVDGINTVNSVLTGGMLKVSDSCPQLIKMIPDYRWDQKAAERGKTAPIKEDDDEVDALRYTVYSSRHIWSRAIDWTVPQLPTEPVG